MEELNLFVKSIFVDNMIFAYFLGMCSYLAVSKNVKTAFGLGVAVTFMLIVTLPLNYLLDKYILQPGALAWLGEEFKDVDLSFLGLIMFIAVIASATQLVEMAVEKFSPSLYNSLGIFLPLIAVNCAILGGALLCSKRISAAHSPLEFMVPVRVSVGCLPSWALPLSARNWLTVMCQSHCEASASHLLLQVLWVLPS